MSYFLTWPRPKSPPQLSTTWYGSLRRCNKLLGVLRKFLVEAHRLFVARFAQHHLLEFKKLVHAHKPFGVFAVAPRLAPEARAK